MLTFNTQYFFDSLSVMWKGMLGIFLVTVVIIVAVMLLNKITSVKK